MWWLYRRLCALFAFVQRLTMSTCVARKKSHVTVDKVRKENGNNRGWAHTVAATYQGYLKYISAMVYKCCGQEYTSAYSCF